MARYRLYKNGIMGHRYKNLYIIKVDKDHFRVVDESNNLVFDKISDYDECEWLIDKHVATEKENELMRYLYGKEIYQLSSLYVNLMNQKNAEGLDEENESLFAWVEKIRRRKAEEREF